MLTAFSRWATRGVFLVTGAGGILLSQAGTTNGDSFAYAGLLALGALTTFELRGWLSEDAPVALRLPTRSQPTAQPLRTLSSNPRTRPRLRRPTNRPTNQND